MPRKRLFGRSRRVLLAGHVGVATIVLGASTIAAALSEASYRHPVGWLFLVAGLVTVALGAGSTTWAWKGSGRALADDGRELRATEQDDGLPRGAFVQDQCVGLEASDAWLFWGTAAAVLGLMLGVVGAVTGPQGGPPWGLAWSLLGLVPAAVCFRAGTGTKYWLTPDGIKTAGWPRRSLRWADVERIVPLLGGVPEHPPERYDAIELQTSGPVQGLPSWWGTDLSVKLRLVEVDSHELMTLLTVRVRAASEQR